MSGAILYFSGSTRPNLWTMPFELDMPFDVETPLGYVIGIIMQIVIAYSLSLHMLVALIIYFGGCLFAMSYVNDLRDFYRYLDEKYVRSNNKRVLRQNLIMAVRKQLTFMEWFEHFAQISSGFIFFEIVGGAISTAANIFLFLVSINGQ